jgi:hypothetical protein
VEIRIEFLADCIDLFKTFALQNGLEFADNQLNTIRPRVFCRTVLHENQGFNAIRDC